MKNVPPAQNDYQDTRETYRFSATINMDKPFETGSTRLAPQEHPISTISLDDFWGYFFWNPPPPAAIHKGRTRSRKSLQQSPSPQRCHEGHCHGCREGNRHHADRTDDGGSGLHIQRSTTDQDNILVVHTPLNTRVCCEIFSGTSTGLDAGG